ncbi:MAG: ABC transporter ATP-binding protein, partial [Polyangiaceae bacterium]
QIREVRSLIRDLGGEQTVLISSHILPEIEATCSEVLVIDQGTLVAMGTIADIRREQAPVAIRLVLSGVVEAALVAIEEHEVVENCTVAEGPHTQLVVQLKSEMVNDVGGATAKLVACCVATGALVREASPEAPSLEDVFSRLTRSEGERMEGGP